MNAVIVSLVFAFGWTPNRMPVWFPCPGRGVTTAPTGMLQTSTATVSPSARRRTLFDIKIGLIVPRNLTEENLCSEIFVPENTIAGRVVRVLRVIGVVGIAIDGNVDVIVARRPV